MLEGHLDGILLAVLEPEPRHGYAIMEALQVSSGGQIDLPTGTVYPTLHRLERAGPPAFPGHRAQHLAGLLRGRHHAPAARAAASGELAMSRQHPPEPAAGPAVESYLADVTARLPGPGPGRDRSRAALRAPGRHRRAAVRWVAAGPGGDR
jgi:PadR family transcriptional regulator PadR